MVINGNDISVAENINGVAVVDESDGTKRIFLLRTR